MEFLSSWEWEDLKQKRLNTQPGLDIFSLCVNSHRLPSKCHSVVTYNEHMNGHVGGRRRGESIYFASPNSFYGDSEGIVQTLMGMKMINRCMIDCVHLLMKLNEAFGVLLSFRSAVGFCIKSHTCSQLSLLPLLNVKSCIIERTLIGIGACCTTARRMNIQKSTCRLEMIHRLMREGKSLITCREDNAWSRCWDQNTWTCMHGPLDSRPHYTLRDSSKLSHV